MRQEIAVKLHLTTSPQHCQQLASELGKRCWGKSAYLDRFEARSKAAAGIWTRIAARGDAGLLRMTGFTVGRQSSQHRVGEDTPSGLQ